MAGAAPTYPPLDLDALRAALSAGRQVRVGILPTGQFPEGTAGRVRSVGTADTDGPEFIQVEVVVGGAKDVVPFAPGDLSPVRRGQPAPEPLSRPAFRPGRRAPVRPAASRPAPLTLVPPVGSVASGLTAGAEVGPATASPGTIPVAVPVTRPTVGTSPAALPGIVVPGTVGPPPVASSATGPTAPRRSPRRLPSVGDPDTAAAGTTPAATPATSKAAGTQTPPAPSATPKPAPRRAGDRTKRQPVTVTLATTGPDHTGWSVHVTVGSRTVVKPTPVHPAQAWTVVTGLGSPEVEQVVSGALAEHRRQAQERADRLAQELAEARAELAAYPDL